MYDNKSQCILYIPIAFSCHILKSIKIFTSQEPWLTPVFLAPQKAEIRRIMVQNQPRQRVCETLSQKYLT
jgi:hypothetical protein